MITKLDLQDPTCPRCSNIAMARYDIAHPDGGNVFWCAGCGTLLIVQDTPEQFLVKAIYPTLVNLPKQPTEELCSCCNRRGHTWRSHQRILPNDMVLDAETLCILGTVEAVAAHQVTIKATRQGQVNCTRDCESIILVPNGSIPR
jgi:hypothetical protein